jgi:hypothetical protein
MVSTVNAQQLAVAVKFSLTGAVSLPPAGELSCVVTSHRAGPAMMETVAPALDRRVRFQVFRI